MYAHLNSGSRVLDAADLCQYINALAMDGPHGNDSGYGQDLGKSNGHNGQLIHRNNLARTIRRILRQAIYEVAGGKKRQREGNARATRSPTCSSVGVA
jgi:hypothetical protein